MTLKGSSPTPADIPSHAMGHSDASGSYRDLCSNCDDGDRCEGRIGPKRPIFFCEEFVVFGAAPMPEGDRAVRVQPKETRSTRGRIGLCVNCDNVETCDSPKPEGGIWHCEEYQ